MGVALRRMQGDTRGSPCMVETFSSSWGMGGGRLEEGRIPGEPRKELIETGKERPPPSLLACDLGLRRTGISMAWG